MPAYRDLFPDLPEMTDTWWARYGLEEAAMDNGSTGPMPAHDRLARLLDEREREAVTGSNQRANPWSNRLIDLEE